jgi:hypothetical protein
MTTAPTTRNGVGVDRLIATIGAIEGRPERADFRFRARTTWETGGRARTTIQDFFGAGGEDTSRRHRRGRASSISVRPTRSPIRPTPRPPRCTTRTDRSTCRATWLP